MIYFLTIAEKEGSRSQVLEKSYERYSGFPLYKITNYLPHEGKYNRIIQVYSFLKSAASPSQSDDDIIVYLDSFDMIALKKLESMEADFRTLNKEIIFGASDSPGLIFPEVKADIDQRYAGKRFKYLHSSFFIGYKKSIIQLFQHILQRLSYYPTPDRIKSDRRLLTFVLFQARSEQYSTSNAAIRNLVMDIDYDGRFALQKEAHIPLSYILSTNPYFIHFGNLRDPRQIVDYQLTTRLLFS